MGKIDNESDLIIAETWLEHLYSYCEAVVNEGGTVWIITDLNDLNWDWSDDFDFWTKRWIADELERNKKKPVIVVKGKDWVKARPVRIQHVDLEDHSPSQQRGGHESIH